MLYYSVQGDQAGPPILFLHAGNFSGRMWLSVLDRLPEFRSIVPDLPGHGDSARFPLRSLEEGADEVARVLETELSGRRANLVGLSFGSYIGMTLMIQRPDLVNRAALSGFQLGAIPNPKLMIAMMTILSPVMATGWARRRMMRSLGIKPSELAAGSNDSAIASATTVCRVGKLSAVFNVHEALEAVPNPTLILAGGKEHPVILNSLLAFESHLPQGLARIAPGLGHAWCAQDPDLFSQTVRAWMKDRPLPDVLQPASTDLD